MEVSITGHARVSATASGGVRVASLAERVLAGTHTDAALRGLDLLSVGTIVTKMALRMGPRARVLPQSSQLATHSAFSAAHDAVAVLASFAHLAVHFVSFWSSEHRYAVHVLSG
jgi:hypothetical protein